MQSAKRCCEGCVVSVTRASRQGVAFCIGFRPFRPRGAVEFFALRPSEPAESSCHAVGTADGASAKAEEYNIRVASASRGSPGAGEDIDGYGEDGIERKIATNRSE